MDRNVGQRLQISAICFMCVWCPHGRQPSWILQMSSVRETKVAGLDWGTDWWVMGLPCFNTYQLSAHTHTVVLRGSPLPSNRHYQSNGDCLEGKRENYQLYSVQYCAPQLCTVQCTHMNTPNSSPDWVSSRWAHFTVLRFIFVYVLLHACVVL